MRREVLIAAAVLVPFGVLVAAGFFFSPEPGTFVPSEVEEPPAPLPLDKPRDPFVPSGVEGWAPKRTERRPSTPLGVNGDELDQPSPGEADPGFPPELVAPLTAVFPEVKRCFADQRLKRPHEVRVRFTPTRDGGFDRVEVDEQNPYLQACLEDVFAEVAWHPSGPETYTPAEHTFSFGPSPD